MSPKGIKRRLGNVGMPQRVEVLAHLHMKREAAVREGNSVRRLQHGQHFTNGRELSLGLLVSNATSCAY